jgi:hypothetical protein
MLLFIFLFCAFTSLCAPSFMWQLLQTKYFSKCMVLGRFHHRQRGSASTVVWAVKSTMGKGHFSWRHTTRTNHLIITKLGRIDDVVHITNPANFDVDRIRGVVSAIWWNITKKFSPFFFSFSPYIYQKSWSDFRVWYVKRRVSVRICATTHPYFSQLKIRGSFPPKTTNFPKIVIVRDRRAKTDVQTEPIDQRASERAQLTSLHVFYRIAMWKILKLP